MLRIARKHGKRTRPALQELTSCSVQPSFQRPACGTQRYRCGDASVVAFGYRLLRRVAPVRESQASGQVDETLWASVAVAMKRLWTSGRPADQANADIGEKESEQRAMVMSAREKHEMVRGNPVRLRR